MRLRLNWKTMVAYNRATIGCGVLLFLVVGFAFLYAGPWNSLLLGKKGGGEIWSDCSQPDGAIKIHKVNIVPNPPKQGAAIAVTAKATLTKNVTGGRIKVTAKYGIIPVLSKKFDLCSMLKQKLGQPCPVKAGTYQNTTRATLPGALPGGHYSGVAKIVDEKDSELACIKFDLYL